ncbi:MAG: 6-phosphofructokinase [Pirellulales bacterium]
MSSTPNKNIKKVAILFSGGPAPAANAVISTAAVSFLRNGIEVVGIKHGYSNLMQYSSDHPMEEGRDFITLDHSILSRSRNKQGIMIGTARANPGKSISNPSHLQDAERCAPMKTTYEALCSMGVDALISLGGDDTLKTANKFKLYQETLPEGSKIIPVVHLPKTIDNDYSGIDFTFGFFTAADFLATEVRNLLYDAEAGRAYFLAECMGRSAGWLAYGAAIAGEASLVMSVEDITGDFVAREIEENGKKRIIMNVEKVIDHIIKVMLAREAEGKEFGVIILAEGLAEMLPEEYLEGVARDDHGHIAISDIQLGRRFAQWIAKAYEEKTGRTRKVNGLQLGYEARCTQPKAFDVMLGAQLGVGAYRALVEEGHNGVMVSVSGQFDLHYVNFEELVDPENLVTVVRFIDTKSDFHKLARFLETYING